MSVLQVKGPKGLLKKEVIFDTCNQNDSSKTTRNLNNNTGISLRSMAVFVGCSGRRCAPSQKGSMFIKRKVTLASRNYASIKWSDRNSSHRA